MLYFSRSNFASLSILILNLTAMSKMLSLWYRGYGQRIVTVWPIYHSFFVVFLRNCLHPSEGWQQYSELFFIFQQCLVELCHICCTWVSSCEPLILRNFFIKLGCLLLVLALLKRLYSLINYLFKHFLWNSMVQKSKFWEHWPRWSSDRVAVKCWLILLNSS